MTPSFCEQPSTRATSGNRSRATSGNRSRATSGNRSRATSGNRSRATSGNRSRATSGNRSRATSGNRSRATSGDRSRATSGDRSRATSGASERTPSGSRWAALLAAGGTAAALFLAPEIASAQTTVSAVSVDGKGIVGGALLGAEVVDLTIGIIGVNRAWPYLVFGAAGAVGGGIGGYFIEQETRDNPEGALYMLAGGMALVIPTVIVSLNATMYKPPEGTSTTTVEPADNQPASSPGQVQPPMPTPLPAPTQTRRLRLRPPAERRAQLPFSLVGLHEGSLALSLPAVQIRPLYSQREVWTYGVEQGTEVRVPLFHATF